MLNRENEFGRGGKNASNSSIYSAEKLSIIVVYSTSLSRTFSPFRLNSMLYSLAPMSDVVSCQIVLKIMNEVRNMEEFKFALICVARFAFFSAVCFCII